MVILWPLFAVFAIFDPFSAPFWPFFGLFLAHVGPILIMIDVFDDVLRCLCRIGVDWSTVGQAWWAILVDFFLLKMTVK